MPLMNMSLANEFESAWKVMNPAEMPTAMKEAKAVSAFIDTGMTAMGGVPVSSQGIPTMANELVSLWQSKLPDVKLVANKEASIIHNLLMGAITAGGKHGVGGFQSGNMAQMANDLSKLYKDKLPSTALVAMKKAKIIDSHVKSCIFRGCGVPTDMTPDISGLT